MPVPLTIATAFSTIVGLISNFRQQKGETNALNHQMFIEWLEYHKHEDIKNLICNTTALQGEVDNLLRADHALIIAKLDAVSTALASLMSLAGEFRGFVSATLPAAEFSEQAVSILKQLADSKSSYFSINKMRFGTLLCLETGGQIQYGEARFLDDDLDQLVSMGLLSLDCDKNRNRYYRITRNGVRLVGKLGNPPAQ
jgi:hypothetical protein